jgi:hypothetical protein
MKIAAPDRKAKEISNIEQGISNIEGKGNLVD